ncbi:MAG TPA: ThiF family adenylyltransferase [Blastocatellia bacterium]|nr:ThiF family adenylyltransferase [Blastocatellia bacterium]
MQVNDSQETRDKSVVVVGAGGNIGSHLVPHLGRMPRVGLVTLIDKDVYEAGNLQTQDIAPRDVGKLKALAQARKLRRINPSLRVEAISDAVERLPLGRLRADVILSCLDSRIARQHVNQFAWRLGVPLIDTGVDGGGLLARVNVYVPGADSPCLECAWDDRDYEALEQTYPCLGVAASVAATNAPSSLGALAASLQAIECQKLLSGQADRAAVSEQVLVDASYHKHYVTAFRRNPNCRFSGHDVWHIRRLDCSVKDLTLAQALELVPARISKNGPPALRIEGKPFVKRLACTNCGAVRSLLRLECSLRNNQTRCGKCGRRMIATGFDVLERLSASVVSRNVLGRSLGSLGLRSGEVFSVGDDEGELHYELGNSERA